METFFERDPYLEQATAIANDWKLRSLRHKIESNELLPSDFDKIVRAIKARTEEILDKLKK